ncbi:AAA family ATPase [Chitinophaga flava]|uniref:AAA+ ATPase domain-containing protein n=1 Tax=Chitinophaga flava TaxID=2259036 RepID=A0A365Y4W3_9BACT|nr:AAA family ATPase [Chitinophaga flava]RBL93341.1 hypothetical protein DF182_12510 [Chitinophaga flava]
MIAIENKSVAVKKSSNPPEMGISYKGAYTARQLYNMKIQEVPFLLEGLIPTTGLTCLTGASDCNKSTLLRQLAIDIASRKESFLGFKLTSIYGKCIYISTEDDYQAISALLNKQYPSTAPDEVLDNIYFIFKTDGHLKELDKVLTKTKTDLVILDNWADVFGGDINQTNKVRANFEQYSWLSQKHNCAFMFVHHQGKRSEEKNPSKNNLLGSQGIEAKMRTVIELRREAGNKRLMTITKGNYTKDSMKAKSFRLELNENNMLFTLSTDAVLATSLGFDNIKTGKEDIMKVASKLRKEGVSYEKVHGKLKEQFGEVIPGLTTLKNWLK